MIMLKIKKWIYFEKKKYNPVILIFSLLLSGLFFFISLEGIAYLIFRDRIKDYTSDVLNRAESLMLQVDTVNAAARSSSDVSSWPCSYENLQHLRGVVWPYSLIKDVGYTSKIGLTCSAIWGGMRLPLSLDHFEKKIQSKEGIWLFGVALKNGISADAYISKEIAVIVSPFSFKRFETDLYTKNFSAVVGNRKHNEHFFKIGPDSALLDKHANLPMRFIQSEACSHHYDLCIAGGGYFLNVLFEHWSITVLLVIVSLISGLMIYIIIMDKREINDSLSVRFTKALKDRRLSVAYQPIYKINNDTICGFESLLRWKDERLGNIGPDVFIPLSEKEGLQGEVTLYVVTHAINDFIQIAKQNKLFLSININACDLDSVKFKETLTSLISKYNIPFGTIILEITERQGGDFEEMKEHIDFYKKHGVRFAIDDFGTGYSNLNSITALDVDEIKIDKSLTDAIGTESLSYNLLPGLYEMFRNISDKIVFEGVETQEQVNYLKKFWPQSSAQGWYYSRALTLAEATELICRHNTK
ncbi:EAL domain-containing protein [Klebsiella pneumoniae]|nr:EAL domain-containing protein [Klebsiella pneumoniae]MCP6209358.1 EAL domain-containing protein [Klebsiella pneumoniae]